MNNVMCELLQLKNFFHLFQSGNEKVTFKDFLVTVFLFLNFIYHPQNYPSENLLQINHKLLIATISHTFID